MKQHDADRPSAGQQQRQEPAIPREDSVTDSAVTPPFAAGVGAAGGAAAGAVAGIAAGPVGSLAGAVVGAVMGAVAGGSAAEGTNPSPDYAHWQRLYNSRPYMKEGTGWEDWEPAYRYGESVHTRTGHQGRWEDIDAELAAGWERERGGSRLAWEDARHAARDAWERLRGGPGETTPGRDVTG